MLGALCYDPALMPDLVQVTKGNGVEFVPRVLLARIMVLGQERAEFLLLGLPLSAGIDGRLGLDLFRGWSLTFDFHTAHVTTLPFRKQACYSLARGWRASRLVKIPV